MYKLMKIGTTLLGLGLVWWFILSFVEITTQNTMPDPVYGAHNLIVIIINICTGGAV